VTRRRIVIVGAGQAGLETAIVLRESGYIGSLTLVGAEPHLPYERPPLSKKVLADDAGATPLEADWDDLGLDVRLGCRALALGEGALATTGGDLDFDGLVVATGSAPRELPGTAGRANVHTLRTIDDALALRAAMVPGARVVVVGAGWIGAEVATAAVHRGCSVTVLETAATPFAAALPPEVGARTTSWFERGAIDLRLGARVVAIGDGTVELEGGESLSADCVVVGIGVRPETHWLRDSGLALDAAGRILVDASLHTGLPGVVAVGDCAAWESRRYGRRLHVEHWDNAQRAPAVAALTLLGQPAVYDPVPYFWSEAFDRMIQFAGHGEPTDTIVFREDPEADAWAACWMRDDRLMAVLAVDRTRDVSQARRLIADESPLDAQLVADASVPLKKAVLAAR
jgi:3-phenylpropionate/trans-cinnamate dioxygenase ferredoxin reductase subunit